MTSDDCAEPKQADPTGALNKVEVFKINNSKKQGNSILFYIQTNEIFALLKYTYVIDRLFLFTNYPHKNAKLLKL